MDFIDDILFKVPQVLRGSCCHPSHYRKPTRENLCCDLHWAEADPNIEINIDGGEETDASFRDRITKKSTIEHYRCGHSSADCEE